MGALIGDDVALALTYNTLCAPDSVRSTMRGCIHVRSWYVLFIIKSDRVT